MTAERPEQDAELTAQERGLAERLQSDRPLPGAGFRGTLGRHLEARDPGHGPRPKRLRLIASGYLAGSALLLTLGALQAAGIL